MEIQTTKELMKRYASIEGHSKHFNETKWINHNDFVKWKKEKIIRLYADGWSHIGIAAFFNTTEEEVEEVLK